MKCVSRQSFTATERLFSETLQSSILHWRTILKFACFDSNPGFDGDVISGSLESRDLASGQQPFEAVSYAWGDVNKTGSILMDSNPVSVTISLEAALRHFRFQDRPRTLWIDYLCINQCDIEERNHQVAKMGNIYGFAKGVLMWPGEETPDSAVGMKVFGYFANKPQPQSHPVWQDYPSSVMRASLLDIMQRSWFQRMWVVQEVGRSRFATLICGRHEVKWKSTDVNAVERYMRMIKFAEILSQWEQMGLATVNMQPLLDMLDLQIGQQLDRTCGTTIRTPPDILDVAYSMRHRLCTDRRDKLYAILGLSGYHHQHQFVPNHNLTVGQMYEALQERAFT